LKKLAILGGPTVGKVIASEWPVHDQIEIDAVTEVVKSGKWGLGGTKVTIEDGGIIMDEKLAIQGGKPVRDIPLSPPFPGASVYGDEEKKAVMEVLDQKSPFRYYGFHTLKKSVNSKRLFPRNSATSIPWV